MTQSRTALVRKSNDTYKDPGAREEIVEEG